MNIIHISKLIDKIPHSNRSQEKNCVIISGDIIKALIKFKIIFNNKFNKNYTNSM